MDRSLDDIIPRGGNRVRGFRRGASGPQKRRVGYGGGGAFGHDDRGTSFGHDDRAGSSFGDDNRSSGGAFRRNRLARRNNNAPYSSRSVGSLDTVWKHDLFAEQEEEPQTFDDNEGGAQNGIETGTRIQISNLAYSVLSEDLKDLFESVGDIKRATVHFDKSGRSIGTATVVFSRRTDALAAIKKYNNVPLDDSPMKISLIGTNVGGNNSGRSQINSLRAAADEALVISVGAPRSRRIISQGIGRVRRLTTGRTQRIVSSSRGRKGGGGGGARRSGFGREKQPTVEELDAEMDAYNQEGK